MVLTGVLRHYATVLMQTVSKSQSAPALREQRSMVHGMNLRMNYPHLGEKTFTARKDHTVQAFKDGLYLREPGKTNGGSSNPMSDPAAMEGMMGMLKGNMMTMIPQTLIMSWINAFFAGFVVRKSSWIQVRGKSIMWKIDKPPVKLPFPLTIRFKQMLQAGVMTQDLDVRWVSSLSWYFLNIFGLQSIFIFILGNDNGKL